MSEELPAVRSDGICVDCLSKPAETADERFCIKCLRKRIRDENPIAGVFNDQRGRSARSSSVLAGAPDMEATEDQPGWE